MYFIFFAIKLKNRIFLYGAFFLLASVVFHHFCVERITTMGNDRGIDFFEIHGRPAISVIGYNSYSADLKLTTLYGEFPLQDNLPNITEHLYAVAKDQYLSLKQGNYRLLERSLAAPFARYEITLPVSGNYIAIRGFISQSLQELPTLSLDAISLNRASTNDPMIEGELRMTLYLRPE